MRFLNRRGGCFTESGEVAKKVRTFLAVELHSRLRSALDAVAGELHFAAPDAHWVEPEHFHVTLEFLGDLPIETVASVCRSVQKAVRKREPFTISISGLGGFPNSERPHTVWAGVGDGAEELIALQSVVSQSLNDLPVRTDHRRFFPHVTIGRLTRGAEGAETLGEAIADRAEVVIGETLIREVVVLGSTLTKQGPSYHVQGRIALEGDATT
ncbi:MAG TPA: RNA 2',3'-cyclic phosphodiesterase [Pirellulales bacterium]